MSLEAAIAENTVALNRVAALLEASNAGREAAVQKITEATGDGAAARPAGRPRVSAAEKKAAEEAAAKAAAEQAKTTTTTTTAAPPSVEDLRAAGGVYLGVSDDLKPARKVFVKSILDHLGIEKIVDVADDDRAKVIGWFEASARGEKVVFDGDGDEPAAEEDDLMG